MLMLDLTQTLAPATEPVTRAEAKAHLRVVDTSEDTLIDALIVAARQFFENETERALITQKYALRLPRWFGTVWLPRPPAVSIDSVTYIDDAGATHALASSDYTLIAGTDPGRLLFDFDDLPGTVLAEVQPITINYTAGYGAAAAIPQILKAGMLLYIGHLFINREAVVATGARSSMSEMPLAVQSIIQQYRIDWQWYGALAR